MARNKPPTFKDVPDSWKYPMGPYHQAPVEYGGEWWMITPFTGTSEPWKWFTGEPQEKKYPEGFIEIFPKPISEDYHDYPNPSAAFRGALAQWENDLGYFKQAGQPPEYSGAEIQAAQETFPFWKMGAAKFYEGRYGWMARWPKSQKRNFETSAWHAILYANDAARAYQVALLTDGILPNSERHPFVPADLWKAVEKAQGGIWLVNDVAGRRPEALE